MVQKFKLVDDNNRNNLFSVRVSFFVAVLALLGMLATSVYAVMCPSSEEFDSIQSYICILPVRMSQNTIISSFASAVSNRSINLFLRVSDCVLHPFEECFGHSSNEIFDSVRFFRSYLVGIVRFAFSHMAVG